MTARRPRLPVTGDREADLLLEDEPVALLIGMLLDQQVPMEWAFRGPRTLRERLGHLDPSKIATTDPEFLEEVASRKPSIHRYPKAMARRIRELCAHLVDHYDGDASRIWRDAADASEVLERLRSLPGFGDEKARITLAVLGKRMGVRPRGWKKVAEPYSGSEPRSVADVSSPAALERVRLYKRELKQSGKR